METNTTAPHQLGTTGYFLKPFPRKGMETDLRTGQGWKQYYSSLVSIQSPDSQEAASFIFSVSQSILISIRSIRFF